MQTIIKLIFLCIMIVSEFYLMFYAFAIIPLMRKLPKEKLGIAPGWFYLSILPGLNFLIVLIFLPFSFPNSLTRCLKDSKTSKAIITKIRVFGGIIALSSLIIHANWFQHFSDHAIQRSNISARYLILTAIHIVLLFGLIQYKKVSDQAMDLTDAK